MSFATITQARRRAVEVKLPPIVVAQRHRLREVGMPRVSWRRRRSIVLRLPAIRVERSPELKVPAITQDRSSAGPVEKARRTAAAVAAGAAGAAGMYLLDPDRGHSRRARLRDQLASSARRGSRQAERRVRHAGQSALGAMHEARHEPSPPAGGEPDDVTLARTVETHIFRGEDVPKGSIVINAEQGILYLRGSVPSTDLAERLAAEAREVPGVRAVKNLLHTA